ncbi:MAG: AAA family ATPase [Planctomycetaceae bacterium]
MPQLSVKVPVVTQRLGGELVSGEVLGFPEVSCCDHNLDEVRSQLVENVLHWLSDLETSELHRRWISSDVTPFEVRVLLEPTRRPSLWREPLELVFPAVRWRQAEDAHVAFVPTLGIEVLVNREEDLLKRAEDEVRATLLRTKATKSLRSLVELQRGHELQVVCKDVEHFVPTPKQQGQDENKPDEPEKKELDKVATKLDWLTQPRAYERDELVRQLAETLTVRASRSVLLVGPNGVGKTAIWQELVRRRSDLGMSDRPCWSTSGSRMVSGMTGFGMWQERCEKLRREAADARAILHLGPLAELMEVGKSESQGQGIASYLRPMIARGDLLVVAECTAEQLTLIERQDAALLRAFQQIQVTEPNREVGLAILRKVAQFSWKTTAELFEPAAIEELDRLHRRFATYSAFPGRPLRFLQNLRRDQIGEPLSGKALAAGLSRANIDPTRPAASAVPLRESATGLIAPRAVVAAFARETGLPLWLLDDAVPLDLSMTRDWFAKRVIGQPEAVSLVVDLLATVKAGLSCEHKPLASFLFLGPTGVGKTEMAKSLAEFLFGVSAGHDSRLIRIDMSEYSDPLAVPRLIGGSAESEGILTARVREQPFAVVLLDEFEKAHPALFDLLLQVLGEGRLTDGAGRLADFRNCVVIMTSNLGAATFQKGAVGFAAQSVERQRSAEHFVKAVRDFVRPELFNRIDGIVPFGPLDEVTARKIVERQFDLVRERDGLKFRRITLEVAEGVVERLLERGFEPRYGARSLKRVLEQEVLAPLAERINGYSGDKVLRASVAIADGRLAIAVRTQTDTTGRLLTSVGTDVGQLEAVTKLQDVRASVQRLQRSPVVLELENEVYRLSQNEDRRHESPRVTEAEMQQRHRLSQRRAMLSRLSELFDSLTQREDEALLALYGTGESSRHIPCAVSPATTDGTWNVPATALATTALRDLLLDLHDLSLAEPNRIRLLLLADDNDILRRLAAAYCDAAVSISANATVWQLLPSSGKRINLAESDWSLDKLIWEQARHPAEPLKTETWQLRMKSSPGEAVPTPLLLRQRILDGRDFLHRELTGVLGLVLEIDGPRVFHRFVGETGLHKFVLAQSKPQCVVETALPKLTQWLPPFGIGRKGSLQHSSKCREYDNIKNSVLDPAVEKPQWFTLDRMATTIAELMETKHVRAAEALIV